MEKRKWRMARTWAGLALAALVVYVAGLVVLTASPRRFFGQEGGGWFQPPCDFHLRLTEVKCLKMGVNPFDVWHGDIILKPFVPNWGEAQAAVEGKEGFTESINAYAPWEYTAMLPLSFLPQRAASAVYFLLMIGCLGVLFAVGLHFARFLSLTDWGGGVLVSSLALLLSALPVLQDFLSGNLAVVSLTGAALMAHCLDRRRDVLAGFCWAVAMLKPQLGLVFAIPLLMRRRWVTCFVAAGTCALLTIPAALLCHTSPLTLILQTPAANTFAFNGSGTAPYFLLSVLPRSVAINLGLALGAALCAWMTWRVGRAACPQAAELRRVGDNAPYQRGADKSRALPHELDWFIYLMPAAVCAMSWSYSQCYCHAFAWFYFLVLAGTLARNPKSRFLWGLAAVSLVSMTRVYNCLHTVMNAAGLFGAEGMGLGLHYTIDSLNSTLDLVLCAVLCWWRTRRVR